MKAADVTRKVKAAGRQTVPATVVLDPDKALAVEQAEQALKLAERHRDAAKKNDDLKGSKTAEAQQAVDQAQADLDAALEEAEDATATFQLASLGPKRWRDLQREHPPTDESRRLYGRQTPWNPETFCDAAIVESMVDPDDATPEWWDDLCSPGPYGLTNAQWEKVWSACNLANNGGVEVPKSLASSNGTTATG